MANYGQIVLGKVSDVNEHAYYIQIDGITYELSKEETDDELKLGEYLEGMIYEDKNRHKIFTTDLPNIRKDVFGWATVVESRRDLGVFVDIGLKNKDIVVSLDDLPLESKSWPRKGDRLYLSLKVDDRQRMWGQLATEEQFHPLFAKASKQSMNANVTATVYRTLSSGAQLITNDNFSAYIHESEMLDPLHLGQVVEGRIIDVHPDGRVNLSTRPRAHEAMEEDAQMLLAILKASPDNFLALHDKSDPNDIAKMLGISKGQFKRAVGNLLKAGLIRQEKGKGLYLIETAAE